MVRGMSSKKIAGPFDSSAFASRTVPTPHRSHLPRARPAASPFHPCSCTIAARTVSLPRSVLDRFASLIHNVKTTLHYVMYSIHHILETPHSAWLIG